MAPLRLLAERQGSVLGGSVAANPGNPATPATPAHSAALDANQGATKGTALANPARVALHARQECDAVGKP